MDILSGYMVKSLLAVFVVYLLWRIQKFIRKYHHWKKITSQVSVIGPLHPIWGSLHLVMLLIIRCFYRSCIHLYVCLGVSIVLFSMILTFDFVFFILFLSITDILSSICATDDDFKNVDKSKVNLDN